jgi:hypothetical protein
MKGWLISEKDIQADGVTVILSSGANTSLRGPASGYGACTKLCTTVGNFLDGYIGEFEALS